MPITTLRGVALCYRVVGERGPFL
ncbi:MAG: hypothetical protein JWL84_5636, partial [Rhodospirillales bacterium]|nr:hypothetical protein [Rhodospirillales bacterium]